MATKVSTTDLPQLQQWLQDLLPRSFKLYHELQSHLRGKLPDLHLYVDRWPDPQAAAAVIDTSGEQLKCKGFYQDMVMGVAGVKEEALAAVLRDKRVVNWSRPTYFMALADEHTGVVKTLAEEMGGTLGGPQHYLMRATGDDLQPVSAPEGMTTSSISEDDIPIVEKTWTAIDADSSAYIRDQVRHFPSVVLKSESGQHVGHMFARSGGMMSALYVLPSFRGQGYAKVIVSQLARELLECGEGAYAIIGTDNQQSLHIHASVGFKIVPDVTLFVCRYSPKESSPC